MSIPPDKFWQLLRESQLLTDDKLASLRARVAKKTSIARSSTKIARLLVANEILTKKQAMRLLAGKSKLGKAKPTDSPHQPETTDGQPPTKTATAVQRKQKSVLPKAIAITLPLFLLTIAGVWFATRDRGEDTTQPNTTQASTVVETDNIDPADEPYEIVESTDALWARNPNSSPISMEFAPPGVQATLRVRLASLLAHPEGAKIVRSLGPDLESMLKTWLDRVGLDAPALESLTIHLLPKGTTQPNVVLVGQLIDGANCNKAQFGSDKIWFPPDNKQAFVFGPAPIVDSIASGEAATMRRETEQLRLATRDADHITLIANPNFLRDEAAGMFRGTRRRLLDGLYEFWTDKAQAVSLGVELSDIAMAEVRMIAREDLPPRRFAALTQQRIAGLSSETSDFLGRVELDPYWQPLAMRFPAMVRFLAEQTRVAAEEKQVAVSTALPLEAIHNLLLASELGLASPLRAAQPNEQVVDRSQWKIEDPVIEPDKRPLRTEVTRSCDARRRTASP